MTRFHLPLIEPDVRISRIRLSDKASCVRARKVDCSQSLEPDQPQGLVQVMIREACLPPTLHLVLAA